MSDNKNHLVGLPRLDLMHSGLVLAAHLSVTSLLMLLFHVPAREFVICGMLMVIVAAVSEFAESSLDPGAFHCGFPRYIAGLINGCAILLFLGMFGVRP